MEKQEDVEQGICESKMSKQIVSELDQQGIELSQLCDTQGLNDCAPQPVIVAV